MISFSPADPDFTRFEGFLLGADLPLQLGEARHGPDHFLADGGLLAGGQTDRPLIAHDEFGWKEFAHEIPAGWSLAGVLGAWLKIPRWRWRRLGAGD